MRSFSNELPNKYGADPFSAHYTHHPFVYETPRETSVFFFRLGVHNRFHEAKNWAVGEVCAPRGVCEKETIDLA